MKIKLFSIVAVLLFLLCLGGCKSKDKNNESNTSETTSVPIVITEDESSETTESDIEEIVDKWENSTPKVEIEVGKKPTESTGSKDTTTSNNSSSEPSSSASSEEQNNSSEDNSSEEGNNSSTKPDDGYFDVAV